MPSVGIADVGADKGISQKQRRRKHRTDATRVYRSVAKNNERCQKEVKLKQSRQQR